MMSILYWLLFILLSCFIQMCVELTYEREKTGGSMLATYGTLTHTTDGANTHYTSNWKLNCLKEYTQESAARSFEML